MKKLIYLLLFIALASAEKSRYDNYRVYRLKIENSQQLDALKYLDEHSDSYDFFQDVSYIGTSVEVMVPPHKFADFSDITNNLKFDYKLIVSNLQKLHDEESPVKKRKDDSVMDWNDYKPIETIYGWLDSLQTDFPQFVNVTTIGTSWHGRELKLLKLSKKAGNRAIFVESSIHAREWIAVATTTWIIDQLLRSTNPEVQDLANNVDWYFYVLANPDGYEHTRTSNRNWRKTRSEWSPLCAGTDPNRNFGFNWMVPDEYGSTGSSTSPCSDIYSGPYAFSEPETLATDRFLDSHRGIFDAFLSMHSYDHSILMPYGNSRTEVPNYSELMQVANRTAARLFAKHGIEYRYGNQPLILYAASGNSQDHAYGKYDIPISYTYEMRGSGDYGDFGFFLPPRYIIPNAEEILESFIGLVQEARKFGRFPIN